MTEQGIIQIVTLFLAFASTTFTGIMAFYMAKLKEDTIKSVQQLDEMALTGKKTHVLVNANMGAQLKITAIATQRIAMMTKDPSDLEAAAISESALHEHERQQDIVDRAGDAKVRAPDGRDHAATGPQEAP